MCELNSFEVSSNATSSLRIEIQWNFITWSLMWSKCHGKVGLISSIEYQKVNIIG